MKYFLLLNGEESAYFCLSRLPIHVQQYHLIRWKRCRIYLNPTTRSFYLLEFTKKHSKYNMIH